MSGYLRNKTLVTTALALILGIVAGAAHKRALESGTPYFHQDAASAILLPVQYSARRIVASGSWFVRVMRSRSAILRENAALRRQVRRLTAENAALREMAAERDVLRRQLGLKRLVQVPMAAADVVSRRASGWFYTATINKGRRSGIELGAAVVDHRGLVGQVVQVGSFSSQIVSLADPSSSVGGMVQRSRSSGIVRGQGEGFLVLSYLPKDADVRESDIVVSSGIGGVVPKGFVIGRVVRVVRNQSDETTSALVRPSVKVDELEQVFVALNKRVGR